MKLVIDGLDRSLENLKDLNRKMQGKVIRKGIRAGGKVWQAAARGEAPSRTGKGKRSIKIRAGKRKKGSISVTVGVSAKDYTGEAFYMSFVLFGHRVGKRALGDARKLVPANNFLKRAYDQSHEQATDTAIETMRQEIEATK